MRILPRSNPTRGMSKGLAPHMGGHQYIHTNLQEGMHSGANLVFASRPKDGAAWSDIYLSTCLTWVTLPGALHPRQHNYQGH